VVHIGASEELVEYLAQVDGSKKPWLLFAGGGMVIVALTATGITLAPVRKFVAPAAFVCTAVLLLFVVHGVRKVVRRQRTEADRRIEDEVKNAVTLTIADEQKRTEPLRREYVEWRERRATDTSAVSDSISVSVSASVSSDNFLILKMAFKNRSNGQVTVAGASVDWLADSTNRSLCGKLTVVPGETLINDKEIQVGGSFEIPRSLPLPLPKGLTAHISFMFTHHRTEWKNWAAAVAVEV
jgi:hypothetical protein